MEYKVFKTLADNSMMYIYKKDFDIANSLLEKILANFKTRGYDIVQTYDKVKLNSLTDVLDVNMIRYMLEKNQIDLPIVYFDETESTNIDAKNLAKKGFVGLVVSKVQKKGKGRNGRSFASADGGIYMSLTLSTEDMSEYDILKLMIISGVAASKALMDVGSCVKLKWPNDIYLNGKKIGGILCEMLTKKKRAVIGVGINVNTHEFYDLANIATSLFLENRVLYNRAEILAKVVKNIVECDYFEYLQEYRRLSCTIGKDITINSGETKYTAKAIDIDENGFLIIEKNGKKSKLISGDVSIR